MGTGTVPHSVSQKKFSQRLVVHFSTLRPSTPFDDTFVTNRPTVPKATASSRFNISRAPMNIGYFEAAGVGTLTISVAQLSFQ
jgi:hypothetical protein